MSEVQMENIALPDWVNKLGVATWVSGPEGRIVFMNPRAEQLLGCSASEVLGTACHEVVGGRDEGGESYCDHNCPVNRMAEAGDEIEPYTLRIGDQKDDEHWIQMLVIPFDTDGTQHLAHCAFVIDRTHVIESYLDRIAARTPLNAGRTFDIEQSRLSKREREVLELLSEDENLYSIAEKLNVSYYTVRNHVQHILGKMGVHSTLEAVALYLLSKAPSDA